MLNSAFENATSDNAEDWANAAATCRRLLKAAADALRPPGPDLNGRKMGGSNYINRLVDWISTHSDSDTAVTMVKAELEYLGRRLDASDGVGHKGAHSTVDRFEASRSITGTYLVLGDILRVSTESRTPEDDAPMGQAETRSESTALPDAGESPSAEDLDS